MEEIIEWQKKNKRIKCADHKMEKVYFCQDSQEVICPECFRESGSTHFGHRIVKLQDEYGKATQQIRQA